MVNSHKISIKGAPVTKGLTFIDVDELRSMATRLVRAVDTLGRLPRTAGTRPAGARSAWPEMIRDSRFAIEATRRVARARPSPSAIDDLDRLAMLMWELPSHQRQLLWARACGVRWTELCRLHRRSRTTLNRDHRRALGAIIMLENAQARQESALQMAQNRIFPIMHCRANHSHLRYI